MTFVKAKGTCTQSPKNSLLEVSLLYCFKDDEYKKISAQCARTMTVIKHVTDGRYLHLQYFNVLNAQQKELKWS